MKKLITLLLALCLLPFAALAEMDEDGDIHVTLPGAAFFFTPVEGTCLTRETNPLTFGCMGMNKNDVVAYMQEMDVFALLYDPAFTVEIQLQAYESETADFDELTEFGAQIMISAVRRDYEDQGWTVKSCELYRAPEGHTFIRTECAMTWEDGATDCITEFVTSKAGYTVCVLVYSMTEEFAPNQQLLGERLADSLWITALQ